MPSSAHMYDVAVVGGGAAGTAAAVGAAQAGARTALFESFGCLGRSGHHEERHAYCGLYTEAEDSRQVVFGVAGQLLSELRAIGGVVEQVRFRGVAALHDPEAVKRCLDVVARRSGVDVFFHSTVTYATRDGGQVVSAAVHDHNGAATVTASTWVDGSGGTTAVHALTVTRVGSGDTVVIHGASGGVGLLTVQLALEAGARVIGTASESGHACLRELGAEPVTYGAGLLERIQAIAPDGVDASVDAVGGDEALDTSLALVADRDRIVTLLASPRAFDSGINVIGNAPGADPGTEIRAAARLELARLAEQGKLHVVVAATYPFAEAVAEHTALATGHTHGKIILVP
jgi:hypothetical protein